MVPNGFRNNLSNAQATESKFPKSPSKSPTKQQVICRFKVAHKASIHQDIALVPQVVTSQYVPV